METLQTIKELKIQTNKIFYDKKSEVLSVYLPDFVFIGTYKKSVRIEIVLDDIYGSLGETQITRQSISIVDFVTLQPISEKTKLKQLKLISKKQNELQKDKKKPVADTRDREPPILNLRVEGKGFEVHPLFGKVEVSKDAVNPPVMIFSVLPVKNKNRSKKDKKEGDRRHLHVYIDFEDKVINRSILSIIVQPKHFHIDIGPLHLDISKKGAAVISLISVIITAISLLYTVISIDPSSQFTDILTGFAPGLGSIIFIGIFLYTLFKEGLYPLKAKISYFLNFDKTGTLVK